MLSVFADSFETLGELTLEVITMLWASPQDAWLEREDRKPCWPTGHMYVHSQGQESHVSHCASHSKGQKQVCVCESSLGWVGCNLEEERKLNSHLIVRSKQIIPISEKVKK